MKKLNICLIGVIIGMGTGYYLGGSGHFTKKTELTESFDSESRTRTVEKIVEKPGGERIVYRTIDENAAIKGNKRRTVTEKSNNWLLGLSYGRHDYFAGREAYTLTLDRKVLGGAYLGLYGTSDGQLGFSLRFAF